MLNPAVVRQEIEKLKFLHPDILEDEEAWIASLESQTDFKELLTNIIRRLEDTKALASGTGERLQELAARKLRFEHRIDGLRDLIFKLMRSAKIDKLEMSEATLSMRHVPPSVIITDDTAIPDILCTFKRTPDKTKIKAALANCAVPGATMSNGSKTISIRIK